MPKKPKREQRDLLQIIAQHEKDIRGLKAALARINIVTTKTTTGNPSSPYEGMVSINTFDNAIRQYAEGAWRDLATW